MMKLFPSAVVSAAPFFLLASAHGATLVGYVDGIVTDTAPVAGTVPANVTATGISGVSNGGNLGTSGNAVRSEYGSASTAELEAVFGAGRSRTLIASAGRDADTTTAPTAAALTTDYFQFTLTAADGATLTLDTLGFDLAVVSNNGSGTTAWAYQLYASVNDGAYAEVGSLNSFSSTSYTVGTVTGLPAQLLDISSLNGSGPIEKVAFRVWQGSDLNVDSTLALGYQNINVQGTVVPEPSALLVGAAGAAGMLLRRRKK